MIITIIGWLAVLAGVARMPAFDRIRSIGRAMIDRTSLFAVPDAITTALGAYPCYRDFLA